MRSNVEENVEGATKVVQTEVPASLYARFSAVADARETTIEEAVREAIIEFTYRNEPIDPDDPIFAPLSWDTDSSSTDDDTAERVDELLYGDRD